MKSEDYEPLNKKEQDLLFCYYDPMPPIPGSWRDEVSRAFRNGTLLSVKRIKKTSTDMMNVLRKTIGVFFVLFLFSCNDYAQAQSFTRDALIGGIVFGYSVDALKDGITFTKAPQGKDLSHLWHLAKYVHIGAVLTVGALNVLSIQKYGWKKTLLFDAVGLVLGMVAWEYTYPLWRKVNWPDWAFMIDGKKQRWHRCEFPHSWNKEIEHILDTSLPTIHYG